MTVLNPPKAGERVLFVGFGSMEEVFAGEINWERLLTLLYKGVYVCDMVQWKLVNIVTCRALVNDGVSTEDFFLLSVLATTQKHSVYMGGSQLYLRGWRVAAIDKVVACTRASVEIFIVRNFGAHFVIVALQ